MAIQCPKCGAEYDATLFAFGHVVHCDCGAWVDLDVGHRQVGEARKSGGMIKNIYGDIPVDLPGELVQTMLQAESVRIERIVSRGHASSEGFWYDQEQGEWVMVLAGAARLRFEGDENALEMRAGDFVNIPARRRHRVEWTTPDEPTVWLAVYYG